MRRKAHRHRSETAQTESRRRINRELRNQKGITVLTRRIPYANLRKGIRRGIDEHLEKASKGRVQVLSSGEKGPIRLRVELPLGPAIEPEIRLEKRRMEIAVDDAVLSNYIDLPPEAVQMLKGMTLGLEGPLVEAKAVVLDGTVHLEPIHLPYNKFRAPLYYVCKKILPTLVRKYVEAEFTFSDPEYRITFSGTKTVAVKFEGTLVFGEEHLVLQVSLQRLAVVAIPIVSSQLDAQLQKWTDGWDEIPSS